MRFTTLRPGSTNSLPVLVIGSLVLVGLLILLLVRGPVKSSPTIFHSTTTVSPAEGDEGEATELFMYCAAGMRYAMEQIVEEYEAEYDVAVQLQYGGSNTLLSQLEVNESGDLYLAGDDSYIRMAEEKGLTVESIPLARMKPIIAVKSGNPKEIKSVDDLARDDVKFALGDPKMAAVGKKTRRLLSASGHWETISGNTTVYKPTVNEVANDIKLGSVDAGVIWDSTAAQYPDLAAVSVPELDAGLATIEIAVVKNSKHPTAALRFARFVAARDKGLATFAATGFEVLDGDVWSESPELTFFSGAVNRAALEPVIKQFEQREGVTVNTIYNGCGILTSTMRSIREDNQAGAFPDAYMACDVYYLETVNDWFQDAVTVSDTDIVIVVQKDNPKGVQSLEDLAKPGVRVVLGQPKECTIGVLSERVLKTAGVFDKLAEGGNIVNHTMSSALLVPAITTGSADAVLAYRTDTRAEAGKFEIVEIDSELAKAIQPYSIARSSDHKHLGRRLFETIANSRDAFESAGFNWRLEGGSNGPVE